MRLLEQAPALGPDLDRSALDGLGELALTVGAAGRSPRCIAVPPVLARLPAAVQSETVALSRDVAAKDVAAGEPVLQTLSETLARLPVGCGQRLLAVVRKALREDDLVRTLTVVPAVCHGFDEPTIEALLETAAAIADHVPAGALAYLRTMDRALERAGLDGVSDWARRGIEVAGGNREAAVAYFRLRSRTSRKLLASHSAEVTFEEIQPVLQRFALMLGRRNLHLSSAPGLWLRPPILPGDDLVLLLPERVGLWPASEDNQAFYKLAVAHGAGRWEYGTHLLRIAELRERGTPLPEAAPADGDLVAFLESFPNPLLAAGLFVMLDGMRIDAALARDFPGLGTDALRLGRSYAERLPAQAAERSGERLLEALFLVSVGGLERLPARLAPLEPIVLQARRAMQRAGATAADAAHLTAMLYGMLAFSSARAGEEEDRLDAAPIVQLGGATFLDEADAPSPAAGAGESEGEAPIACVEGEPEPSSIPLALDEDTETKSGGVPLPPEEIERLIREGFELRIGQGSQEELASLGLFVTDLLGKLPRASAQRLRELLQRGDEAGLRAWIAVQRQARYHTYDEWDYRIRDYRHQWCRVAEIEIDGDGGRTFHRMLEQSGDLVARLKREFLLMRPEQFRRIRGMEDGEEFDLNAVVAARVDLLRRKTPSERLYLARRREERDVATLFLIDMSASTDEPLPDGSRRVIDLTKETLVVMTSVLEEIGDAYAVYGFSGYGHNGVEVYQIKTFQERLGPAVRGRLGAIEPKRSTRMGAALRHAMTKFNGVSARARHIILLSDGFPQDFDYGDDRTSNVYGIRDTTKALEELEGAGIRPFCITIDPSGHDYLREMCSPSRYAVIDDVRMLPEELPRIYQSVVGRT
ncbi:MAG: VWA domain-containing protein [Deltaproteobacteria bacterium]|nr:MAG: VWA domain-containing protein [Deltaproteobacteria bacterium]